VGVGTLACQWQCSAGDSDAAYSDIVGATTAIYEDADGSYVGRYYRAVLNATGASQQVTAPDRGYLASETVPSGTSDVGKLLLTTLLRIVVATVIVAVTITTGVRSGSGVVFLLSMVIGLIAFVIIDVLVMSVL
jgi:hypothetical protein